MCDDVLPKLIQALPDIVNPVPTVYRHSRKSERGGGGGGERRRDGNRETDGERKFSRPFNRRKSSQDRQRGGGGQANRD